MPSHHHIHRPDRAQRFGQSPRLLLMDPAPMLVRRDPEILVNTGAGFVVRWHLTSGSWPAVASAAIGLLRGFHHAKLAPGATWPMHIQEDLQAVTHVVAGVLEHSDSLGNHAVLTAGGVQQRWLGWGSERPGAEPVCDRADGVHPAVAADASTRHDRAGATCSISKAGSRLFGPNGYRATDSRRLRMRLWLVIRASRSVHHAGPIELEYAHSSTGQDNRKLLMWAFLRRTSRPNGLWP